MNFSESTEEITPLTEEQKKEKLAELRHKAAEKKSAQSEEDKLANKRNEVSAEQSLLPPDRTDPVSRRSDARAQRRRKT